MAHIHIKLLSGLNIYKATGPDDISTRLINQFTSCRIWLNYSPSSSKPFRELKKKQPEWEDANIVPIVMKSNHKESNYRPLSLTAILFNWNTSSVATSTNIWSSIYKHLQQVSILADDEKHGFIKRNIMRVPSDTHHTRLRQTNRQQRTNRPHTTTRF